MLLVFFCIPGCDKSESLTGVQTNFPVLTGEYFSQEPPGLEPKRFPPSPFLANQLWFWHGSPVFSPDGQEMYWVDAQIIENLK